MFTVTETVSIAYPASGVFEFVTEARNRSQWDSTVISERLTSPEPLGVGSTLHSSLRAIGREVDFDWRVTSYDPPTRMSVISTDGPLQTSLLFEIAASGAQTRLSATIDAEPAGMMRFVEPMIAEGVRSNLATSLGRVKALLEAR